MICLDTTAIIDLFKKEPSLIKRIKELEGPFCSTAINQQEIFFGLNLSEDKYSKEEIYYDNFFRNIFIYPLESKTTKTSSKIFWELEKQGGKIDKFDSIIAGILMSNNIHKILTKNTKHFERIPNLKVLTY